MNTLGDRRGDVNLHKGSSRQIGKIYAKTFRSYIPFFQKLTYGQTLLRIFACDGSNDAVSSKDVPFGN